MCNFYNLVLKPLYAVLSVTHVSLPPTPENRPTALYRPYRGIRTPLPALCERRGAIYYLSLHPARYAGETLRAVASCSIRFSGGITRPISYLLIDALWTPISFDSSSSVMFWLVRSVLIRSPIVKVVPSPLSPACSLRAGPGFLTVAARRCSMSHRPHQGRFRESCCRVVHQ